MCTGGGPAVSGGGGSFPAGAVLTKTTVPTPSFGPSPSAVKGTPTAAFGSQPSRDTTKTPPGGPSDFTEDRVASANITATLPPGVQPSVAPAGSAARQGASTRRRGAPRSTLLAGGLVPVDPLTGSVTLLGS